MVTQFVVSSLVPRERMEQGSGLNGKLARALQVAELGWRESLQLAKERQSTIEIKDLEIEALRHNVDMLQRQLFIHMDKGRGLNVALCNAIEDIHLSTAELAMELRKCIISGDITDKANAIAERIKKRDIEPSTENSINGLDRLSRVNNRINSLLYWMSEKVITDKQYHPSLGAEIQITSCDDDVDKSIKYDSTKSTLHKVKKTSTAHVPSPVASLSHKTTSSMHSSTSVHSKLVNSKKV